MSNKATKKVAAFLKRYKLFSKALAVARRTPAYAIHWYVLLGIGIVVVIANIVLASIAFTSVLRDAQDGVASGARASTINRGDLEDVLRAYQTRSAEFSQLEQAPPDVTDPGR